MYTTNIPPIKLEKGIPKPEKDPGGRWPFSKMDIGDSFAVPTEYAVPVRNALSSYTSYWRKQGKNYKFSTRNVDGGLRVWRDK